jgi:hypothetical protein
MMLDPSPERCSIGSRSSFLGQPSNPEHGCYRRGIVFGGTEVVHDVPSRECGTISEQLFHRDRAETFSGSSWMLSSPSVNGTLSDIRQFMSSFSFGHDLTPFGILHRFCAKSKHKIGA